MRKQDMQKLQKALDAIEQVRKVRKQWGAGNFLSCAVADATGKIDRLHTNAGSQLARDIANLLDEHLKAAQVV